MGKTAAARVKKRAPRADRRRALPKRNPTRAKVSVALAKTDLVWAEGEAKKRKTTLSAVFSAALQAAQRDAAWERCFAAIGDTDELTDDERAQIDGEFRELGLIP